MTLLLPWEISLYATYDFSQQPTSFTALMINRAQVLIDSFCVGTTYTGSASGSLLEKQTWTETAKPADNKECCDLFVALKHYPIISITSARLTSIDGSYVDLDTSLMRINNQAGYFEYPTSSGTGMSSICAREFCTKCYNPMVEVTYEAGFDPIPEDLKKATALLTEQLTITAMATGGQYNTAPVGGLKSFHSLNYGETYESIGSLYQKMKGLHLSLNVLDEVELILNKYRQALKGVGIAGI